MLSLYMQSEVESRREGGVRVFHRAFVWGFVSLYVGMEVGPQRIWRMMRERVEMWREFLLVFFSFGALSLSPALSGAPSYL